MKSKSFRIRLRKPAVLAVLASVLAFLVALPLFPFSPAAANQKAAIQFVSPDWVAQNAKDPNLRVLDVRVNPFDYFTSHLPNAVHVADNTFRGPNGVLPVQYWQPDKLSETFSLAGVTNKSRVLVYSDGRDILGATMVAYLLERSGLKDISVLDGGFTAYKAANLPVTKEFPRYAPTKFVVKDNPSLRVTLADVRKAVAKPGSVTFIDPRPAKLFRGEENVWVRNGHIPGARNIPWPTFTEGNAATNEGNFHKLKSLDEIKKLLADRNIKPSDNIVVTCSTGREATLQYAVLKHLLGYKNVRVYEGSWTEYSSQPDLPVATGPEKAV